MVSTRTREAAQIGLAQDGSFIASMVKGTTNLNMLVLGDSTGNETTEWVYLLLVALGEDFPEWTIQWRVYADGSPGSYGSAVTIQTGSGARTLTVYNCSVPGVGYNYIDGRDYVILAVEPALTIVSYGYNSTLTDYRGADLHVVKALQAFWPKTEIVLVAQPPTLDGDAAVRITRSVSVRKLAADEGFGLIDADQAFRNYGDYEDLIGGDQIHPNAQGSQVWADEAYKSLRKGRAATAPAHRAKGDYRRWMPANSFMVLSGSPALAVVNNYPTWAFDAASDEAIIGTIDIPTDWNNVEVYLAWFAAATSGDVVWVPRFGAFGGNMLGHIGSSPPALTAVAGTTTITASAVANTMRFTKVFDPNSSVSDTGRIRSGRPLVVSITRDADAAGDTMSGDAQFCGLMFERWD